MVEGNGGSERSGRDAAIEGDAASATVTDGGVPALDEFVRVLSERRRRCILYCLREDNVADIGGLARRVAARLDRTSPKEVSERRRETVEISLVHVELPMLADAGVVSYDRRTGTLRLDHPSAPVKTLLDACATFDERGCTRADPDRDDDGSGESDATAAPDRSRNDR